jgi:hypothetical protein
VVIKRGTSSGNYPNTAVDVTETSEGTKSYTDSNLTQGQTYYYKAEVQDDFDPSSGTFGTNSTTQTDTANSNPL